MSLEKALLSIPEFAERSTRRAILELGPTEVQRLLTTVEFRRWTRTK